MALDVTCHAAFPMNLKLASSGPDSLFDLGLNPKLASVGPDFIFNNVRISFSRGQHLISKACVVIGSCI